MPHMNTAAVSKPSVVEVGQQKSPVMGPEDILVEMQACGICGSDVEKSLASTGSPPGGWDTSRQGSSRPQAGR